MAAYSDIPVQCRGTVTIDHREWHYRLDKYGQLMIVPGPDPRDWAAIDSGALDYTRIASLEHMQPGFTDHDGPKTRAACHLCNPPVARDKNGQTITTGPQSLQQAAAKLAAEKTGQAAPPAAPVEANSPPPAVPDPVALAEQAKREAEAHAAELQAQIDHLQKQALRPAPAADTTAADAAEGVGSDG